jgi:NAD(P)-dependent dehydrogenase (short-subunit alcohol dehydrogenase family)
VADEAHRRALAAVARDLGRIDLLVHNASELGPSPLPSLLGHPIDALREVYEVNVVAPVALTQALWPWLAPDARIIAVTSDAAVEAYEGWGGYGSSKAALDHAFAVLAEEEPQWRVYRVDPGDLRTAMHQAAFPGEDISDRPLPEARVPAFRALIDGDRPSGRYVAADLLREEVSA